MLHSYSICKHCVCNSCVHLYINWNIHKRRIFSPFPPNECKTVVHEKNVCLENQEQKQNISKYNKNNTKKLLLLNPRPWYGKKWSSAAPKMLKPYIFVGFRPEMIITGIWNTTNVVKRSVQGGVCVCVYAFKCVWKCNLSVKCVWKYVCESVR